MGLIPGFLGCITHIQANAFAGTGGGEGHILVTLKNRD